MIYKNIIDDKQVKEAVKLLESDSEKSMKKEQAIDYNYILAKK